MNNKPTTAYAIAKNIINKTDVPKEFEHYFRPNHKSSCYMHHYWVNRYGKQDTPKRNG